MKKFFEENSKGTQIFYSVGDIDSYSLKNVHLLDVEIEKNKLLENKTLDVVKLNISLLIQMKVIDKICENLGIERIITKYLRKKYFS